MGKEDRNGIINNVVDELMGRNDKRNDENLGRVGKGE